MTEIHGRGPSSTYVSFEIREASTTFGKEAAPEARPGAFQAPIGLGVAVERSRRSRYLARRAAVAVDVALVAALAAVLAGGVSGIVRLTGSDL